MPKFTVEETDMTQPFLQSPILATILTNQNPKSLDQFIEKFQKIKKYENSDVKFCLLVNSDHLSPEYSLQTHKKVSKKGVDYLQEEKEPLSPRESLTPVQIHCLKDEFFSKLDRFANEQEYSIPQDIGNKYTKRKRDFTRDRFYKEPKQFFIKLKEFFRHFLKMKRSNVNIIWLVVAISLLLSFELVSLDIAL